MTREDILEQIRNLEDKLYECDEEQEELDEYRKQASKSARMLKIMIDEYEKEGFTREFAIELMKLSIGGSK